MNGINANTSSHINFTMIYMNDDNYSSINNLRTINNIKQSTTNDIKPSAPSDNNIEIVVLNGAYSSSIACVDITLPSNPILVGASIVSDASNG